MLYIYAENVNITYLSVPFRPSSKILRFSAESLKGCCYPPSFPLHFLCLPVSFSLRFSFPPPYWGRGGACLAKPKLYIQISIS